MLEMPVRNTATALFFHFRHLVDLKCLFLQNNRISRIENISNLYLLTTLNLSHNQIELIENISNLHHLHTLDVAHNKLKEAGHIEQLRLSNSISVLDLSNNLLDDPQILIVLSEMPNLKVLTLTGNPIINKTAEYRRNMILLCPGLTCLDGRPIRDKDRDRAQAWKDGGPEAEQQLVDRWAKEEEQRMHQGVLHLIR